MQLGPAKIEVSVSEQVLRLVRGGEVVAVFPVSTSRFGTGTEEGSFRTPLGRFRVAERIGDGEPLGRVFRSRHPEGRWEPGAEDDGDLVLTRILWLEGLEEANANTKDRYIYIHGTNHEDAIGRPESQGCVRMRNSDVARLYELVDVGTEVQIVT